MKSKITLLTISLILSVLPFLARPQAGTLDPTFAGDGIAMFSPGSLHETAHDMVILEDSSMIICGVGQNSGIMSGFLMRILPDGTQDMSFGTSGITWISYGAETYAYTMERQEDGKLVVSGLVYTVIPNSEFYIARFLPNGTVDASFNGTGHYITSYGSSEEYCETMIMQPDGKFVLAGRSYTGSFSQLMFTRINNNGTLDLTFGTNGFTLIDASIQDEEISSLGLLENGQIVGVGYGYQGNPLWGEQVFMAKLTSAGQPVSGFGTNGVIIPPIFTDVSAANDLLIDNDSLYITGYMYNASNEWELFVAKLDPNGNAYTDFGNNGMTLLNLNPMNVGIDILKTGDNKLYVCGTTGLGGPGNREFLLARYLPSGELDDDLDGDGYVITPIRPDWDEANALGIAPNGKIVLAGMTSGLNTSGNNDIAMTRYLNDYIPSGLMANFSANPQIACEGQTVQFTDMSFSTDSVVLTWNWWFEGGNPSTSVVQNPTVTYANDGIYDVQLIVYDGIYFDTLLKANYIHVESIPAQPGTPSGPTELCGGYSGTYTVNAITYADAYDWQVTPSNAGTITGTGTSAVFLASTGWTGTASIIARATNQCGNGPWSNAANCQVYHNPLQFQMIGDGAYCEGDPGAEIVLDGSETGVSYELYFNNAPTGTVLPGTGSALSFGFHSTAGLYSVSGYTDHCFEFMVGQVYVHLLLLPPQPAMPNGPEIGCDGQDATYTTQPIAGAEVYIWTLSPEEAGILTPVFDTAHITWNTGFTGKADLSVHVENICGTGPESEVMEIDVFLSPVPAISGSQLVCDETEEMYETADNPGSFYSWEVTGGVITAGPGTHQVTVLWGTPGAGTVTVTEESADGCLTTTEPYNVTIDDCTGLEDDQKNLGIRVYPVPAGNVLNIEFLSGPGLFDRISISNSNGQVLLDQELDRTANSLQVNLSEIPSGLYFITVHQKGAVRVVKSFIRD